MLTAEALKQGPQRGRRALRAVAVAGLESETAVGSLHGTWRQGGLQLSGAVNLGRTGVDIERSMSLGGQASAVLGYSGRTGDGSRGDHLVNVGLRVVF